MTMMKMKEKRKFFRKASVPLHPCSRRIPLPITREENEVKERRGIA